MELGTASILVQLLLIFVLVVVFSGRRYLQAQRERRQQHPGGSTLPTVLPTVSSTATAPTTPVPAPSLVDLPPVARRAPATLESMGLVPEELLPPCFAETCADWSQVGPAAAQAPDPGFSLSDWSAPTDRMELDDLPDPASLDWALDMPVETRHPVRATPIRSAMSSMSCTIAPQVRHCA